MTIMTIIGIIIIGLIAGYIARLLVPGKDPMGIGGTLLLGVVGSLLGGFLWNLVRGGGVDLLHPGGLIGSIVGAIIVLLIYRAARTRRA